MALYLIGVLIGSAALGVAVARSWAVVVPVVAISVFYAGLHVEWWGDGVGDAWELAMFFAMATGAVGAAAGVAARRRRR